VEVAAAGLTEPDRVSRIYQIHRIGIARDGHPYKRFRAQVTVYELRELSAAQRSQMNIQA
jgi:hypothetical protein